MSPPARAKTMFDQEPLSLPWRCEAARSITSIVVATRLGVLAVGFLGILMIGYAPGTPPYRVYQGDLLNMPARWDTGWYMGIAVSGYAFDPQRSTEMQNIAFFPLYPMLMRYGGWLIGGHVLWAGVIISIASFALSMRYFFALARARVDRDTALSAIALLAASPFALFFSTAYTESLFLLCTVAACYFFERDRLDAAAAWGLAAGLSRPPGCLLSIVLALIAARQFRTSSPARSAQRMAAAAMPGLGMLIFSAYIYSLTGYWLQWAAQHAAWGRSYNGLFSLAIERWDYISVNGFYGYITAMTIDALNLLPGVLALATVIPIWRRLGVEYAALVLVNVMVPLLAGGTLSLGRITSVLFPSFLWLSAALRPSQRSAWVISFALLQTVLAVAFFTWRPLY